jgi:hypothetical protein
MIIDVRPKPVTITDSQSVFSFRTTGGGSWPVWDRFIAIHDSLAMQNGTVCGCRFFFQRVVVDPDYVKAPAEISAALNHGLTQLDENLVNSVAKIIPNGRYRVALSTGVPVLAKPGDANDYFTYEQPALWNSHYENVGVHDPLGEASRHFPRRRHIATAVGAFISRCCMHVPTRGLCRAAEASR